MFRLIAAALLLAGCTTPTAVGISGSGTTIQYDDMLHSRDDATAEAQRVCSQSGAQAVFRSTAKPAPLGHRFDQFDCVKG
jgi:hypothetical protein